MRQLGIAMQAYAQDCDEHLPFADRWCDATSPYRGGTDLHCPADAGYSYSYAMNYKASRQPLAVFGRPSETVILFESDLHRANAYDKGGYPGDSVAKPGRHEGQDYFAYVDGHVSLYPPNRVGKDRYRLTPPRPVTPSRGPWGMPGGPGGPPGGMPGGPGGPPVGDSGEY